MATLFADVGKPGADHIKNVFPAKANNFETEVTAKTACGAKIVLIAKRLADGSISGTFKPSMGFSAGDVKGEWKGQFATNNTSKIDTTFTFASLAGLKLKSGADDDTFYAGTDYVSSQLASNLKFTYNFKGAKAPSVEAATNYVHGCYSLGAKLVYPMDAEVPELEGKAGVACGKECELLLSGKKGKEATTFALGYFHQLSKTRTLASTFSFAPGTSGFLGGVSVVLATSNQVSDDTLVKARFDTQRSALGFGLVQTLNSNVSIEMGTDFPANFAGSSIYNLKFLYKA